MVKNILITIIRTYQLSFSYFVGRSCRFYPSCSEYTKQAIELHGSAKGSLLGVKRICKCHPFHEGGIDNVPTTDLR
ncbi:MAG: membrane protein insertion efficiency factor YidD [Pseudomonadales bacterium]|jgi:putative membrane protein insertion efficiency factor